MAGQLLFLPDMALEAVAAFASSEALPWVCRRLWEMLGHRHMEAVLHAGFSVERLVQSGAALRTLAVRCAPTADGGAAGAMGAVIGQLAALQRMPHLETLALDLTRQGLAAGSGLDFLPALRGLRLTALTLKLAANRLPASAAVQPLASLARMTTLQSLSLHLMDNRVGDGGAEALAGLAALPQLRVLRLDLESNGLTHRGAGRLALLGEASRLQTLELTLSHNRIGDQGAANLVELLKAPALARLALCLDGCGLGDNGVGELAAAAERRPLAALRLSVQYGCVGDYGVEALTSLRNIPGLQSLEVRLAGNQVSAGAAAALQRRIAEANPCLRLTVTGLQRQVGPAKSSPAPPAAP
eukprot:EG_transcript_17611